MNPHQAVDPTAPARDSSLRDVYYALFRHAWKGVAVFAVIVTAVSVANLRSAAVYQSEAKIMLRLGRESMTIDPTITAGDYVHVSQSRAAEIYAELEMLRSRELAESVVDALGPAAILDPLGAQAPRGADGAGDGARSLLERMGLAEEMSPSDRAVLAIQDSVGISAPQNGNILRVTFESVSPETAQKVVAHLVDSYLEMHVDVFRSSGSYEFFSQQTEEFRSKLEETEEALRKIKSERNILSVEDERAALVERTSLLEAALEQTRSELAWAAARATSMGALLEQVPEKLVISEGEGVPNTTADLIRQRLFELRIQEREIATKFSAENLDLQSVRAQIETALEALEAEDPVLPQKTYGPNANHQQIQLESLMGSAALSSLEAKIRSIEEQLSRIRDSRTILLDEEVRISRLLRDQAHFQANWDKYSESLEQARIDEALDTSHFSNTTILQPATHPIHPIRPRRMRNLSMGLFFALVAALGTVFFLDLLDHSIETPEDIEQRLGLGTLASLPRTRPHRVEPVPAAKNAPAGPWRLPAVIEDGFAGLRERLRLSANAEEGGAKVIGVASCRPREGASTVAANLATSLAGGAGGKVLLVDASLLHPSAHEIFQLERSPGLADLLSTGQRDLGTIQAAPVDGLEVLAAGVPHPDPARAFPAERVGELLSKLRERYDQVVVDLPPVAEDPAAVRLASECDHVVLVVETERVRWEVLRRTQISLGEAHARVAGIVLNKRRYRIPDWLYKTL